MIVLDSPVISSLMQATPDQAVQEWIERQPVPIIFTTSVTVYEIQRGIALLPEGHRKRRLDAAFAVIITSEFQSRVLSFDSTAARRAAELSANRTLRGLNIGWQDTMIAGIALANGAAIATRNVKDFRDLGARVVNPWDASSG